MDLARLGNLHSLLQEVLQRLVEKRAMLGHKDLFPPGRKVLTNFGRAAVSISEVTARVLRIGKDSCPIPPAAMSLQHLKAITSPNVTNQVLLPTYRPESRLLLRAMIGLARTL
jgi:hypothetical protein